MQDTSYFLKDPLHRFGENTELIAVPNEPRAVGRHRKEVGVDFALDPRGFLTPRIYAQELTAHCDLPHLDLYAHFRERRKVVWDDHNLAVDRSKGCPLKNRDPMPRQLDRDESSSIQEYGEIWRAQRHALNQVTLHLR